jgi:hypothetical protein
VADEILAERNGPEQAAPGPRGSLVRRRTLAAALASLVLLAAAAGLYAGHLAQRLHGAEVEIARMASAARNEVESLFRRNSGLSETLEAERDELRRQRAAAWHALVWALNDGARVRWDEPHFGDRTADRMHTALTRLHELGFQGTAVLTAHLGRFCLVRDAAGRLGLAGAERTLDDCDLLGHPLDGAGIAGLQSVRFLSEVLDPGRTESLGIAVELAVADTPAVTPSPGEAAGPWNRAAAAANRVALALRPPGLARISLHATDLRAETSSSSGDRP